MYLNYERENDVFKNQEPDNTVKKQQQNLGESNVTKRHSHAFTGVREGGETSHLSDTQGTLTPFVDICQHVSWRPITAHAF